MCVCVGCVCVCVCGWGGGCVGVCVCVCVCVCVGGWVCVCVCLFVAVKLIKELTKLCFDFFIAMQPPLAQSSCILVESATLQCKIFCVQVCEKQKDVNFDENLPAY